VSSTIGAIRSSTVSPTERIHARARSEARQPPRETQVREAAKRSRPPPLSLRWNRSKPPGPLVPVAILPVSAPDSLRKESLA